MADTGFKSPAGNTAEGTGWTNPTNAYSSNDQYASQGSPLVGTVYCELQLSWDGGTSFTAVKSNALSTTEGTLTYGGSSDNWGRTWDDDEFSNANFQVRASINDGLDGAEHRYHDFSFGVPSGVTIDGIEAEAEGYATEGKGANGFVDHIQIKVYYTVSGPTGVKTINDTAIASVKTINDTAIGSVKTINDAS